VREAVAFVAVGSNLEPERHIPRGLAALHRLAPVTAASPFYRSAPIGRDGLVRPGEPMFVNGMVAVRTRHPPLALRRILHHVEAGCGRVRTPDRYAPRTLDLDLVAHGGRVMCGDLPFRRFLALPFLDIAPGFEVAPGTPLRDPGGLAMEPVGLAVPVLSTGSLRPPASAPTRPPARPLSAI
jgi:2-amino-4-hydroxy-6-hydroxymethyldihydropteridine diphosphokinase